MTSQTTVIPGLFSSEQSNLSSTTSAPSLFSGSATSVNTAANTTDGADRFIHLRGSGLIMELTNEKDNLDAGFVHSKRLIDEGEEKLIKLCVLILIDAHRPFISEIARLQRGGAEPALANPHAKQTEKVYIPYDAQKTVQNNV